MMADVLLHAFDIIAHLAHGTHRLQLIEDLCPDDQDYDRAFRGAIARLARAAYMSAWKGVDPGVRPELTDLMVWGARAADLAEGRDAAPRFPGGYADIAID